jgi:antirestriction protein ArdC
MSNNFKPLAEQVSEKMIADLKAGKSIFHKPISEDGTSQFQQPFNPSTKNAYKGPTALVLLMQNRQDPRWMTLNQANYNRTPVLKGEKGTLTNFFKNSEFQPVKNERGEPELKENGKPKMESVKLEEPVLTNAWLYNGAQLKNMPEMLREPQELSPIERAEKIIAGSKVEFVEAGSLMHDEDHLDRIQINPKESFESPEHYYATALQLLAHATAHENRLNRPVEREPDMEIGIKEALRVNLAAILISAELNLPYELGDRIGYVNPWAQVLKDNPNELFKAAADAQKIADYVLKWENPIAQKQEAGQSIAKETLVKGDIIPYKETQYKVLAELKNKVYQMQDLADGRKFKMSSKDGVFNSLLEAKYNPQEKAIQQDFEQESVAERAAEEEQQYQMER